MKCFLWVVAFVAIWAGYLCAQDKTESPYFFIPNQDVELESFPLLHTEAIVNIAGVIADVQVTQLYQNNGKKPIEAVYIFPASTNAAVYDMRMTIGDRTIRAKIKEREEARRTYEEAREAGKSASLLEQHRPNVFQMSVANIMPGDTIKVELFYTELLIPEEGVYEFVYPTVVGPRYNASTAPEILAAANQWVSNPYLLKGNSSNYTFGISLSVQTGMPVKDLKCQSHEVDIQYKGINEVRINLKDTDRYRGDKDFILRYRLKGQQVETGVMLYEGEDENFFLMMMQPPERPKVANMPAREYIFVVDVSGSMDGFPLSVSKDMMRELMDELSPKDKFNVLLFAASAAFLSEQSLPATKENMEKALLIIDQQRGGGGTEMLPAIKRAMSLKKEDGFARSFVILTDGYISAEADVFDYIRDHLSQANFFAFGIGTGVNRHLIEGIAHAGASDPFIVEDPQRAPDLARQFRKYIETPVLTDISIDFQGLDVYDVTPAAIPDLMGERPILVFGKYRGSAKGQLTVNGENAAGKFSKSMVISSSEVKAENNALRYLWARHRLKTLADYANLNRIDPDLKQQVTGIGLQYNLLTDHTSFVAVDERVRNTTGKTKVVNQPLPLPEGVENSAVGVPPGANAIQRDPTVGAVTFLDQSIGAGTEMEPPRTGAPPPPPMPPPPPPVVEEVFKVVEEMPRFPGCEEQESIVAAKKTCADQLMLKYIYEHIQYPPKAPEHFSGGTVVVEFVVGKDGLIRDASIVRDIGYGFGEEALRVIRKMIEDQIRWIPGKQRGRPVDVLYRIPIRFELERR